MVQIQKTEKKEETEFKVVHEKTISPCINNCGNVAGNPATNNMCQTCFSAAVSSAAPKFSGDEATSRSTPSRSPKRSHPYDGEETVANRRSLTSDRSEVPEAAMATAEKKRAVNRCSGCRKKVGLTGFRCRCGDLFCAEHRYSDRHDCSYDYKAVGREAIARENPVVKAAKIVKV